MRSEASSSSLEVESAPTVKNGYHIVIDEEGYHIVIRRDITSQRPSRCDIANVIISSTSKECLRYGDALRSASKAEPKQTPNNSQYASVGNHPEARVSSGARGMCAAGRRPLPRHFQRVLSDGDEGRRLAEDGRASALCWAGADPWRGQSDRAPSPDQPAGSVPAAGSVSVPIERAGCHVAGLQR